ncbi:MAG: SoxR reducing system RseC family protein [Rhodocyclaceae bacterium]|nr:SoxR reducing system RseC family protein [Rhodocyclaceae bacterium]
MIDTIERAGQVVGFDGDEAVVRLENASSCGTCGSRGSCGSAQKAAQVIRLHLPAQTRLGDRVTLSMPSSSLALAALLGYLLPPASLLLGAVIAASRYGGDAAAVLGAGVGFAVGLLLARLISRFTLGRGAHSAACDLDSNHGEPK